MGQHGAHLGPVGPRWAPCWPHEPCYQGSSPLSNGQQFSLMKNDISFMKNDISDTSPLASTIILLMMTSSNGNIYRVTGHLCGEFTGPGEFPAQRQVMRSFDVFFVLRLNKRVSKQSWGWWLKTPSYLLWRHCNVKMLSSLKRYPYNVDNA